MKPEADPSCEMRAITVASSGRQIKWRSWALAPVSTLLVGTLFGCAAPTPEVRDKEKVVEPLGTGKNILNFVVAGWPPSYDAHRESTYAVIQPFGPFYSLLIRVNPENPSSPTDFVCDVCEGDVPQPTEGGTRYTFKIRKDVKFHDGTALTARDVKATFDKIIFPPPGITSARRAFFRMVESVQAPDDYTVVFNLKFPSGAFIPALAIPYNWIYSKKDLDAHGYTWHQNHINGSGPFIFVRHQPEAFVEGRRNPHYHHQGQPYLAGYRAIFARKMSVRIQAIRGNRAAIEFRGFPPKARDDLVATMGDKITVQETDWNCRLLFTPNHSRKPFDDVRVRRALTLAIDRWGGSQYLQRIAIVKTVGGVVFPNHPLAASKEELRKLAGYWPDMEQSREEAKRLLRESGHAGMAFEFHNRGVDQPYKVVGTWLVNQWQQIGLKVTQRVQPSPAFYATLRKKGDFDVSMDFDCWPVVNPIADSAKFLGSAYYNYGRYQDLALDQVYDELFRTADVEEEKSLLRRYEKRVLDEMAHMGVILWWYRIVPYRSYVKGWKIAPSHYLNQQLDTVSIDDTLQQH